jgi:hypothetical protein
MNNELYRWWLIPFVSLGLIFVSGLLGNSALPSILGNYPTQPINSRPYFDQHSETLIDNAVDVALYGLPPYRGGFMFQIPGDPRHLEADSPELYRPDWKPTPNDFNQRSGYHSQLGLQARIYAAIASGLGLDRARMLSVLRIGSAFLLAAVLSVVICFFRRTWGPLAAIGALITCALSTGFNLFAMSLYWSVFLHVAPTAFVAATALDSGKPTWQKPLLFGALAALFLGKFLSGFEFVTVTISAATLPIFVLYSVGCLSLRQTVMNAAAIVGTGMAAFCISLLTFDTLYRQQLGDGGLAYLLQRSQVWAVHPPMSFQENLLQIAKVLVVNGVDIAGYGIPLGVLAVTGLLSTTYLLFGCRKRQMNKEVLVITAAFLSSASWVIFQGNHLLFHPRYGTILTAFPFLIVLAAGAGRLLDREDAASRSRNLFGVPEEAIQQS